MSRGARHLLGLAVVCVFALVAPAASALGQEPEPDAIPSSGPRRFATEMDVETRYDSNVFLLDQGKKDDLRSPSSSDLLNGRFSDMESVGDLVTTLHLEGALKGRGLLRRALTFTPEIEYDYYARNQERSSLQLGMTLRQSLPKGGMIGLRGEIRPDRFSKNYLADAVDLDASGTITHDERIYRPGQYSEGDFGLEYRVRLAKTPHHRALGARLELGAGYYFRNYDAQFPGRDLRGPMVSSGLSFGVGRSAVLDLRYEMAGLSASVTPEVLILDEPDFNLDFNGDGAADDLDVRAVQWVDRSHQEHSIGAEVDFDADADTRIRLSYEYRLRNFSSRQPFDVVDRDRHDHRSTVAVDLSRRVARDLRLALGGEAASQTTNRGGDPGASGDTDDYSRVRTTVRLVYRP